MALSQLLPQHKYISDKSKALHFLLEQLDKLNTKKYVYGKGNRHSSVAPQCSYMVLTIPKKNKWKSVRPLDDRRDPLRLCTSVEWLTEREQHCVRFHLKPHHSSQSKSSPPEVRVSETNRISLNGYLLIYMCLHIFPCGSSMFCFTCRCTDSRTQLNIEIYIVTVLSAKYTLDKCRCSKLLGVAWINFTALIMYSVYLPLDILRNGLN